MKKLISVALAAATVFLVGPSGPAGADTSTIGAPVGGHASLSFPNVGYAGSSCKDVLVTLTVAAAKESAYAVYEAANVSYRNSSGSAPRTDVMTGRWPDSGSHKVPVLFCPGLAPRGVYAASGTVTFYSAAGAPVTSVSLRDSFIVDHIASSTSAVGLQGTTVVGGVKRNGAVYPNAPLRFQKRNSNGTWTTIAVKYTSSNGYASIGGAYGTTYRVQFPSDFRTYSSISPTTVTLKAASTLTSQRAAWDVHGWRVIGRLGGPYYNNQPVHLQEYASGTWRTVKSATTSSTGYANFYFVQPSSAYNAKQYRLRYNGTYAKHAATTAAFTLPRR